MTKAVAILKGSSAGAGLTVFERLLNMEAFDTYQLGSVGGSMQVFGSGDGVTFNTTAIALIDLCSTTPSVAVTSTTAQGHYGFRGRYQAIRVVQNGGTAVTSAYLNFVEAQG
jgi:hypothetical protein